MNNLLSKLSGILVFIGLLGILSNTHVFSQVGACGDCSADEFGNQATCGSGSECRPIQELDQASWTNVTSNLDQLIGEGVLTGWDFFIADNNQSFQHVIVVQSNNDHRIYFRSGNAEWSNKTLGPNLAVERINLHQLANGNIQISLSNADRRLQNGTAKANLILTQEITLAALQSPTYLEDVFGSRELWTDSSGAINSQSSMQAMPDGDHFLSFTQGYDHLGNTRQHMVTFSYSNAANTDVLTYMYRRYRWRNGTWSNWRFIAATNNSSRELSLSDLATKQAVATNTSLRQPEGAVVQLDFKYFNNIPYYYLLKQTISAEKIQNTKLLYYGSILGSPARINISERSYCSPTGGLNVCHLSDYGQPDSDQDEIYDDRDVCPLSWGPSSLGCLAAPISTITPQPTTSFTPGPLAQPIGLEITPLCTNNKASVSWSVSASDSTLLEGIRLEYCKKTSENQTSCSSPERITLNRTKLETQGEPKDNMVMWAISNIWRPMLSPTSTGSATFNIARGESALVRIRTYQNTNQFSDPSVYVVIKNSGPEGDLNNDCSVNVSDYNLATQTTDSDSFWMRASNNSALFLINKLIRHFGLTL